MAGLTRVEYGERLSIADGEECELDVLLCADHLARDAFGERDSTISEAMIRWAAINTITRRFPVGPDSTDAPSPHQRLPVRQHHSCADPTS